MIYNLNKFLERVIPFITSTSVILGIIFSTYIKDFTFLVPWLFAFMTFEGSLSMNFNALKGALMHPFPVIVILFILHIIMPLWALTFGYIVFPSDELTITGITLGMIIPTGISSFIWVAMKKGNTALTLSIILIDSLLSPFVIPLSLSILFGKTVEMNVGAMMSGLFFMIVLPSLLAIGLNELTKGKASKSVKPILAPISKLFLAVVVMLNGSAVAPYFYQIDLKLILIILSVLIVALSGYFISYVVAKLLRFNNETLIACTFSGGMRNISAGAVIAIHYFPAAVVLPVICGMLFQQILASLYGVILDKKLQSSKKTLSA